MAIRESLTAAVRGLLSSPNLPGRRPVVDGNFESNVPGVYIIGDLAGAPVVKLAMEQGFAVAEHIAAQRDARGSGPDGFDVIVAGAGAAGLNAALVLQDRGLRVLVLEKNRIANTIEDFPEGKWVYAEPDARPPKGKLWLDGARKEDLLARWHEIIRENRLDVRVEEGLTALKRLEDGGFEVHTPKAVYRARRVILATGQRGNPRKLGAPGEDRERVYHRLYSPKHYRGEQIVVVGGGNSAVEAALALAEQNHVTLSYRGSSLVRVFRENLRRLAQAVAAGRVRVIYRSRVAKFGERTCTLEIEEQGTRRTLEVPYDHAFVLIGAEAPADFLRSLGIRMENEWAGNPLSAALLTLATLGGLWLYGGHNGLGALAAAASVAGLILSGRRGNRWAWLGVSPERPGAPTASCMPGRCSFTPSSAIRTGSG